MYVFHNLWAMHLLVEVAQLLLCSTHTALKQVNCQLGHQAAMSTNNMLFHTSNRCPGWSGQVTVHRQTLLLTLWYLHQYHQSSSTDCSILPLFYSWEECQMLSNSLASYRRKQWAFESSSRQEPWLGSQHPLVWRRHGSHPSSTYPRPNLQKSAK